MKAMIIFEDDMEFENALSEFWQKKALDHWVDIGNEATKIYEHTFWVGDLPIEEDSPLDSFFKYTAIAGFDAAVRCVAQILKIPVDDLEAQIDDYWAEKK